MDARTSIKNRLPSRRVAEGTERALRPAIAGQRGIKFDLFDVGEIFKKTPYIADLKPGGRDVAKDMFEVGGIPLLMKMLLDHGHLHGGDIIGIDGDVGTLNVKLTGAELSERKTKWKPRQTNHMSGALWKYAQQVGPAVDGAVIHPGGAHEKQCYADI
jgi:dihydroxyacid dehydratase/phosphogluconate dehydratase